MFSTYNQLHTEEQLLPTIPSIPLLSFSPQLQQHMIDMYAEHIYPYFPIVDKQDIIEQLTNPISPSSNTVTSHNMALQISPLLLFSILALSASYMSKEFEPELESHCNSSHQNSSSLAEALFNQAQYLSMHYVDSPRCSTVLAFILMSVYLERQVSRNTKARMFAGMSYVMAQELALHRASIYSDSNSAQRHLKTKLFWSLFAYDRVSGTIHHRPLFFDEQECKVPYPNTDDEPNSENVLTIREFIEYIKLATCIGRIVKLHSSQPTEIPREHWTRDRLLASLDSSLAAWFLTLPRHMQYTTQSLEQWHTTGPIYTLNIFFYWALIILHGPYIAQEKSNESTPLKICKHAADQIRLIMDDMEDIEDRGCIFDLSQCLQTANIIYGLKEKMGLH